MKIILIFLVSIFTISCGGGSDKTMQNESSISSLNDPDDNSSQESTNDTQESTNDTQISDTSSLVEVEIVIENRFGKCSFGECRFE